MGVAMRVGRRQMMAGMAAAAFAPRAFAKPFPRLAAIDWAMLETSVALGVVPLAATELKQFRRLAVEPALPETTIDLGLRGAPNMELLNLVKPDLILLSPFYRRYESQLEPIAPLISLPFYVPGEPPFDHALQAVSALGERLDRAKEAQALLASTAEALMVMREKLARFAARQSYVINIGDAGHFRAFGADSMFGDMLARLGLPNAWRDLSRFTFAAPVPLEALADNPEARIVIVSEIPVESKKTFLNNPLWTSLEPVRKGRVVFLENVNPYGGITAGMRFARLLSAALSGRETEL